MANQIRLKRASGSDPTASDLVLGEPAVRTDTGELFFLKDNGNVAKVSGGGGLSDGDKGDIVVSNSGDTLSIDSGVIDNANIASNAAIAGTKISPDFGSQNITGSKLTINSTTPIIDLAESDGNPDYRIFAESGAFVIRNQSSTANRFVINSDGHIDLKTNVDCEAGLDVTGDIISTAHITGVSDSSEAAFIAKGISGTTEGYIQLNCAENSHGIKLKSPPHSASASYTLVFPEDIQNGKFLKTDSNGNLSWATPTDTNTQLSNAQVRAAVEAASDSNVFTDADHSKLNGIEASATADQSASEILTLIKTVDGSGSGLDADTLDGVQASGFVAVGGDTMTSNLRVDINSNSDGILGLAFTNYFGLKHADQTLDSEYMIISKDDNTFISASSGSNVRIRNGGNDSTNELIIGSGNNALTWRGQKVFHAGNDGSGSGLDSDTLDGLQATSFLRSDQDDTTSGKLNVQKLGFAGTVGGNSGNSAENYAIYQQSGAWSSPFPDLIISYHTGIKIGGLSGYGGTRFYNDSPERSGATEIFSVGNGDNDVRVVNDLHIGGNITVSGTVDGRDVASDGSKLDGIAAGATNVTNNNQLTNGAGYITSASLAGVSDGGNAASLDGIDSSQFLRSDQDDTMTGELTINGRLDIGNGSNSETEIRIYKADNNVSDHIQFYNGTSRVGEIGCEDTTWLRINQETNKNIYTPRYIRADGGFFVDGASKGINGSGNFVGGTIAGASDVSVSASNNTIVRRHSSGYIFANYINTTDNSVGSGVTAIMCKQNNNDYHRSASAAAVRAFLNVEDGATAGGFPSGTRMIFQQTSAPTGWTKDTSDTNQRALRVVSGSASSGGSVDFTSAFASRGVSGSIANTTQGGSIANGGNNTNNGGNNTNNATAGGSVSNHTLSTGRMPSHRHIGGDRNIFDQVNGFYGQAQNNAGGVNYPGARYDPSNPYAQTDKSWTSNEGSTQAHNHGFSGSAHSHSINAHSHSINAHSHSFSGSAHNHSFSGTSINLAVRYLDVIIAQKD